MAALYIPRTRLLTLLVSPSSSAARRHHLQLHPVVHRRRALLRLLHHAWRVLHQQVLHQLQHVVLWGGLCHLSAAQSAGAVQTPLVCVHAFFLVKNVTAALTRSFAAYPQISVYNSCVWPRSVSRAQVSCSPPSSPCTPCF